MHWEVAVSDDEMIELWEESFTSDDRKLDRQERKRATKQDRSKYKKTDRAKRKKKVTSDSEGLLRGRVLSVMPQKMTVDCEGKEFSCVLRGVLKKERTHAKNLVAVGDIVLFDDLGGDEGVVVQVEPRHSQLSRSDSLQHRKRHIIAANLDQVLVTVSVVDPILKPSLVDRYIIATRQGGMTPVVVVNKIDLLEEGTVDEQVQYEQFLEAYTKAGVQVLPVSVEGNIGIDALRQCMKNRASVFSGQSGVGKSSLINIITGLDLPVGETVAKTRKGSHTTTRAHLVTLEGGGWCVDTPGIKSFGVWDLDKEQIQQAFEEIWALRDDCGFSNCTHTHERDCAVKKGVEEGSIAPIRYQSYMDLMHAVDEKQFRR